MSNAINRYDEFGIPASTNLGRIQYTGQMWLTELGMYNYKARIYSPTLGRFMQTDPIDYADGLNWYNYVGGDPVNATDPTGTDLELFKNGPPDIVVEGVRFTFSIDPGSLARPNVSIGGLGNYGASIGDAPQRGQQNDERARKFCHNNWWKFGNTIDSVGQVLGDVGTGAAIFTKGQTGWIASYGSTLSVLGAAAKDYAGDPYAFRDLMPAIIPIAGKGVVPGHLRSKIKDSIADLSGAKAAEFLFPKIGVRKNEELIRIILAI